MTPPNAMLPRKNQSSVVVSSPKKIRVRRKATRDTDPTTAVHRMNARRVGGFILTSEEYTFERHSEIQKLDVPHASKGGLHGPPGCSDLGRSRIVASGEKQRVLRLRAFGAPLRMTHRRPDRA